jgi:hypothetical protein
MMAVHHSVMVRHHHVTMPVPHHSVVAHAVAGSRIHHCMMRHAMMLHHGMMGCPMRGHRPFAHRITHGVVVRPVWRSLRIRRHAHRTQRCGGDNDLQDAHGIAPWNPHL